MPAQSEAAKPQANKLPPKKAWLELVAKGEPAKDRLIDHALAKRSDETVAW